MVWAVFFKAAADLPPRPDVQASGKTEIEDVILEEPAPAAPDLTRLSRTERLQRALSEIPFDEREELAVSALVKGRGGTDAELSYVCGWRPGAWRTQMLLLCHRRRAFLWPGGMGSDATNATIMTALTVYNPDQARFTARPDMRGALMDALPV